MNKRILTLPIVALAAIVLGPVTQAAVVPYTPDASTGYLFHFDGAAGGSTTANTGTVGGNALSYSANTYPGDSTPATLVTNVLGASAFTGFGLAANMNPNSVASNATAATANGVALGFDLDASGTFVLDDGTPLSGDRLANHTSILTGTGFTLEAMVFLPSITAGNQEIISTDIASTANNTRGLQFRITGAGKLEFFDIGAGAGAVAANDKISTLVLSDGSLGDNAFVPNTWFHAAASFDGSNLSFYWTRVDASKTQANLLESFAFTSAQIDTADPGFLAIGNEGRVNLTNGSQEGVLGSIDEVRISTTGRTANQFIFVPEPSTASMLLLGVTALIGARRRRG